MRNALSAAASDSVQVSSSARRRVPPRTSCHVKGERFSGPLGDLPPWAQRPFRSPYAPALLDRATVLRLRVCELLSAIPARQPADDPAQHEPRLRREGNIGDHADDDAERQAQHGSERDRGSDAHTRESMRGVSARGELAPPWAAGALRGGCRHKAGRLAEASAGQLSNRAVDPTRGPRSRRERHRLTARGAVRVARFHRDAYR